MKKKTVVTTETREVWVIGHVPQFAEELTPQDSESESSSQSLTLQLDHDAKKNNDASAESTATDGQE